MNGTHQLRPKVLQDQCRGTGVEQHKRLRACVCEGGGGRARKNSFTTINCGREQSLRKEREPHNEKSNGLMGCSEQWSNQVEDGNALCLLTTITISHSLLWEKLYWFSMHEVTGV